MEIKVRELVAFINANPQLIDYDSPIVPEPRELYLDRRDGKLALCMDMSAAFAIDHGDKV